MSSLSPLLNRRILVIDDNRSIHEDFRKVLVDGLQPQPDVELSDPDGPARPAAPPVRTPFELTYVQQGKEGLERVVQAVQAGRPFAMAFVDVRMPPGWDGITTIEKIWESHPDLEIVLCTAYSDYSWAEMISRFGSSDRLVILKKPFDNIEVLQLAAALTEKWHLRQLAADHLVDLETLVNRRTEELRIEIAERRQAEEAALKWQKRYDLLASFSNQVVYDHDVVSGTVVWSGSVKKVLGLTAAQLMHGSGLFEERIHPDDHVCAMQQLAEAAIREDPCSRIYRFKCGRGEYRWVHDRSFVLDGGEEQTPHRLGIMEDITERRLAEQRIREQAALLNKTQDAILLCNLDYQVQYWNHGAEVLYGWTEAEAVRAKVPDLLHREALSAFHEASASAIATGTWAGELQQVCRDGREVAVECRWAVLRDDASAPISLLMVNTDVTKRKQLEARFLRAQRLESIGCLASGIAHDLNNIFTPLLMAGQLLHDKACDPETRPLFEVLEASSQRGAAMVRQILTFARGADGIRTPLNIIKLLAEVEVLMRDTFTRTIEVKIDFGEDLHSVYGNATQLQQVLMNLCVNARDAMPNGGMLACSAKNLIVDEAFARMQPDAQPGWYVAISIADTGTGMTPEVLDRIFEPFFTTKAQNHGTGLGLSTTLGIVKSHGGFIDVESTPGRGTCFFIYLPASKEPSISSQREAPSAVIQGRGEMVLVVDDEPMVREITRAALELNGYQVSTAADGTEAVTLFAADPARFQLVITDMMMPFMDGAATIRALRRLNPGIAIIAVSGVTGNRSYDRTSVPDNVDFLLKPYTADKLVNTVSSVLRRKGSGYFRKDSPVT